MLTLVELERYKRQITVEGFGIKSQEKLKESTALVAGIGGLGGTAAFYLAAAGIGKLIFIHEGNLTRSNLNRQILMTDDWVGRSRVLKAKETINKFAPEVDVKIFDEPIKSERVKEVFDSTDIILDCRHNFPERRILNRVAVETGIPMIESAMNAMEGYLFNIIPGNTPCLNCLYPEDDPNWDPFGFSVLGAVSGALGCFTAIEAIKILTRFREPLFNKLLCCDWGSMDFKKINIRKRENCEICGKR